jgi:hypothetical protein
MPASCPYVEVNDMFAKIGNKLAHHFHLNMRIIRPCSFGKPGDEA